MILKPRLPGLHLATRLVATRDKIFGGPSRVKIGTLFFILSGYFEQF